MKEQKSVAPALTKGFAILDLIAREPGLGFAEIRDRLALPNSSCHHLIATLCQLGALQDFQKLGAVAQQAHPTHEHYLPLLYAAGAVLPSEMPRFFNTGYQSASISMRSVLWG